MTINCKGTLIDLASPKIMGILNITPDSFFDGGKYKDEKTILSQVEKMLSEGATFIDVGANSSRPGAAAVSEKEELKRILPIVQLIIRQFPETLISIDTFRSLVAQNCLEAGAAIINDISAGAMDEQMFATVAKFQAPYVMMHMKGTPQTMQTLTDYKDVMSAVRFYFSERVAAARKSGVIDIIIDPGFGFAKNLEQNYTLLKNLDLLTTLGVPILAGLSRKSMIYKLLETDAQHALNGTTALNMVALERGASILRVHDVTEAMECVQLAKQLM